MNLPDDEAKRHDRRSLDRIAAGAANILDVPGVVISVIDREQQECVGAHGIAAYPPCALCRDAALSGRPIVMQDVTRRSGRARSSWGAEMIAYAGVPLPSLDGARIGTLAAFAPTRRAWQSRDVLTLRNFADAAAAILDLQWRRDAVIAQVREELEVAKRGLAGRRLETTERERAVTHDRRITREVEQSLHRDELTGLLNRRGLFAVGNIELEKLRRDERCGLLLYIDIDGLKTTNDHCGRAAGDELLRAAAGVLRSAFDGSTAVARLGGDEFVVLTTDAPRSDHAALVARMTAELDRCNDRRDPAIPVVWSLGLVSIEPGAPQSLDALMSEADRQMYRAKAHRRGATEPVAQDRSD